MAVTVLLDMLWVPFIDGRPLKATAKKLGSSVCSAVDSLALILIL